MKHFYEKNDYLINSFTNVTFEEILSFSEEQFRNWCIEVRKQVVYCWDVLGIPPRVGYNEDEIVDQFQQMETFPVNKMLVKNELTGERNVIRNTHTLGNAVNQWFPTMMKVRINYSDEDKGRSIYDFFADDSLLERFITYAKRHFKRDSFYAFSNPIQKNDDRYGLDLPRTDDAINWLYQFHEEGYEKREKYSYWLAPTKEKEYSGYNEDLKGINYLIVTKDQIKILKLDPKHLTNLTDADTYYIRVFELGQKVFPIGFKFWRVSFNQYATNFPPLIAKWVYDNYLPDGSSVVWDPSMGWAGRLLGCLAAKDTKQITYLGCDPNTDHMIDANAYYSKYDDIENFYCNNVRRGGGIFPVDHNDLWYWCSGSEVMQYHSDFKQWKDKVDLVFTSPPYFNREAYSEDETQSYKKFGTFDDWVKGFLHPTLDTAYRWLKPDGYIAWNIADLKIGKNYLPLEQKSCEIMESLGMRYCNTIHMCMSQMPGANRLTKDGEATSKNSVKVDGMVFRSEPIFIYQK